MPGDAGLLRPARAPSTTSSTSWSPRRSTTSASATTCSPAGASRREAERRASSTAGRLPAARGAGDVRPHRPALRPAEPRHDAGLDGRWRQAAAAAADLAAGDRALDCCTGTGDLAFALADRVRRPGERGRASTSPSGCSTLARDEGAPGCRGHASWPATPSPCRSPTTSSTRRPSAFGIRNVDDLDAGLRRDGAGGAARRARRDPGDHHARPGCGASTTSGSTGSCPSSGACSAATAPPTPTSPRRCAASRSPRRWPRRWPPPGLQRRRAGATFAGGIVALHHGRAPR